MRWRASAGISARSYARRSRWEDQLGGRGRRCSAWVRAVVAAYAASAARAGLSMVWYGMVWYVVVVVVVVVRAPSTCRREKLPDTLSLTGRKGAVGRRHASRACADDDRGGGGGGLGAAMSGGGCAQKEEGGATCVCYPGALPRCGGGG